MRPGRLHALPARVASVRTSLYRSSRTTARISPVSQVTTTFRFRVHPLCRRAPLRIHWLASAARELNYGSSKLPAPFSSRNVRAMSR